MATDQIASDSFPPPGSPLSAWTSWCDSCHTLPSSVFCRADSAYLCLHCDSSIHSANSLARRHHRLPLLPNKHQRHHHIAEEDYDDGFLIAAEVDEYLDLLDFASSDEQQRKQQHKQMMDTSFTTSESISSIEAIVVPENSMVSISSSQFRTSEGTIEQFSDPSLQMPQQFTPMDREARVLRYREKRKTRKFQKIIRYASRKAYAETRPRIKGRFAKRTDVQVEVDHLFAAPVMV